MSIVPAAVKSTTKKNLIATFAAGCQFAAMFTLALGRANVVTFLF
jgi:hypothetical protein